METEGEVEERGRGGGERERRRRDEEVEERGRGGGAPEGGVVLGEELVKLPVVCCGLVSIIAV